MEVTMEVVDGVLDFVGQVANGWVDTSVYVVAFVLFQSPLSGIARAVFAPFAGLGYGE